MSSDWRALIHYVDEGGVTTHMEQNTKIGFKQTQRGRLRWGGLEGFGVDTLGSGYSFAHRLKETHRVA